MYREQTKRYQVRTINPGDLCAWHLSTDLTVTIPETVPVSIKGDHQSLEDLPTSSILFHDSLYVQEAKTAGSSYEIQKRHVWYPYGLVQSEFFLHHLNCIPLVLINQFLLLHRVISMQAKNDTTVSRWFERPAGIEFVLDFLR